MPSHNADESKNPATVTNILLIEDNPGDARMIQILLSETSATSSLAGGYNTIIATTLAEGIQQLEIGNIDVALLDLSLPDSIGPETFTRLVAAAPGLPILVLTGLDDDATGIKCVQAGAQDYLIKGRVDGELLARAIRYAIVRKKTEDAVLQASIKLGEQERDLAHAQAIAHLGSFRFDIPTGVFTWSEEMFRIFGIDPAKGAPTLAVHQSVIHPEDWPRFQSCFLPPLSHTQPKEGETRIVCSDGTSRVVYSRYQLERNDVGEAVALVGTVQDITERKRVEDALRQSEELYRTLSEASHDNIYYINCSGVIEYTNRHAASRFGLSPDEMIGRPMKDFFPPEIAERQWHTLEKVMETLQPLYVEEKTLLGPNEIWLGTWVEPLGDANGKAHAVLGVSRDITESKRAEAALVASEENFRHLVEAAPIGLYVRVGEVFRYINQTAVELLRATSARDFLGKPVRSVFHPDYVELLNQRMRKVDTERAPQAPLIAKLLRIDGVPIDVETSNALIEYNGERGVLVFFQDVGIRLRAQIKLRQAMNGTVRALVRATESRDPYTAGHQVRVAKLSTAIARELGLSDQETEGIQLAASIHDIGKISVPAEILSRPGKLAPIEKALIQTHPQSGFEIVKDIEFPYPIAEIIIQHHERMDGSGYPNNLLGEKTSLAARILATADVVEAMASHRPYRPPLGLDAALAEIQQNRGKLYDPDVVDSCLRLFHQQGFLLD